MGPVGRVGAVLRGRSDHHVEPGLTSGTGPWGNRYGNLEVPEVILGAVNCGSQSAVNVWIQPGPDVKVTFIPSEV